MGPVVCSLFMLAEGLPYIGSFSGDEDTLARNGAVIDLIEDSATLPAAQSSFVTTILAGGVSTDDDPSV